MHVKYIGQICLRNSDVGGSFSALHPLFTSRLTSDILPTGELKAGEEKQGQPPPFSVTGEHKITLDSMQSKSYTQFQSQGYKCILSIMSL